MVTRGTFCLMRDKRNKWYWIRTKVIESLKIDTIFNIDSNIENC